MKTQSICMTLLFACIIKVFGQADSVKSLPEIQIMEYKAMNGIGHLSDVHEAVIYAGKKSEVILIDSLDANKAINNTRQILGRVPGLNIVESESGGFTANGIATRGLNPNQSMEMNSRQNGYTISADVYGYNETYYVPPMEAVERIELLRGAASLQFGAQFGGLVNYILKEAPKQKVIAFNSSQSMGSYGMYNSFQSLGGTYKKFSYYTFVQYRHMDGYRPNSQQWQLSGFGKVQYNASEKVKVSLEYSLLRNKIQMPGGLSDAQFAQDPRASFRARNWLKTPWNIIAASLSYQLHKQVSLQIKSSFLFGERALVWRNEDGGPATLDLIDTATNAYVAREVGIEKMKSIHNEARLAYRYKIGNQESVLSSGIRYSYAQFERRGGGEGTTGSDFDLSITGDWGYSLAFSTQNVALFAENLFRIGNRLSITPGIRMEYIGSTVNGYVFDDADKLERDAKRSRRFLLTGLGVSYKVTKHSELYGNISEAYRPIDYSQLEPFGSTAKIDPNLRDAKGFNSDLGYRGSVRNFLNFDISAFYMSYGNRIGVVMLTDSSSGDTYAYRTNIANSRHFGAETYVEFNLLKCISMHSRYNLSIYNAFAYVDAHYTSGEFKGKRVETAVSTIERVGIIFSHAGFSASFQANFVGDAFGDASNVRSSEDPIAGYIPAYQVFDFSARYQIKNYGIKAGVNNLTGANYFTRRTDEYPGPGIIPAVGRSFYVGLTASF